MQLKKIEYAVGTSGLFIRHLHRDGFDRGMIATFGNSYKSYKYEYEDGLYRPFTSYENNLISSLASVGRSVTDERTRLYDSIEDVIKEFWKNGRKNRPWLLTIITDGQDNESYAYRRNPAKIGRFIAERFNHEPSNFIFVIGVGEDRFIDKAALETMGRSGGFTAMTIAAFPLLEMLFLKIALQVTTQVMGYQVNVGNLSWGELARIRQVSQVAFDYAFLIDCSGSMGELG